MLSKIINGISHPLLATRYVSRKLIDGIFGLFPSFESFTRTIMMDRKLPKAIEGASAQGFPVRVIYDIGARHGWWSEYLSRHIKASYFLFEANEEHAPQLKRRGFPFFTAVLSDSEKEVLWYGKLGTGDSYYKENTEYYRDVNATTKKTTTLDALISDNSLPLPDLVKIDTQGSEIDILNGGMRALSNAKFVYIECSLVNYNEGAPGISDVLSYMRGHGFIPCEMGEEHRKNGALIQLDILFMRKDIYHKLDEETEKLNY